MDFNAAPATLEVIAKISRFIAQDLLPLEREFLLHGYGAVKRELEEKRSAVKKLGLWAPCHARERGGMGLDLVAYGLVCEALGQTPLAHYVFGCQAPDAGNIELLEMFGSEAQKQRWAGP